MSLENLKLLEWAVSAPVLDSGGKHNLYLPRLCTIPMSLERQSVTKAVRASALKMCGNMTTRGELLQLAPEGNQWEPMGERGHVCVFVDLFIYFPPLDMA